MWFLFKGTFWFSMVLVVLSYLGAPEQQDARMPSIEIGSTIAAATGAYDYLSGLCTEKPDVCVKGAETLSALGQRAKAGALVAYQILDEHLAEPGTEAASSAGAAQTIASTRTDDPVSDLITTGTVLEISVPVPRPRPTL